MRSICLCLCLIVLSGPLFAQSAPPSEAELDQRTDAISKTLRCVVCQNQSIYDSDAPLAEDMRALVRKRVIAGDTDAEARAYLRKRYGDYVLLTPPFQFNTWVLWLAPGVLLLLVFAWLWKRPRAVVSEVEGAALPTEDRARVHAALKTGEEGPKE